jgi:rhamnogalacturonyl hydrolase YesR
VKKVADAVLRDFPEPPPFNWGEGTMLTGMMRAYELTQDERYLQFVRRFADHHYEAGIGATLNERGYCGHWGPGYPMLMLHEATGDRRYLELAEEISEFIMKEAERTADGGLSHFNGKPQLWVDTLDMCCPVLSNLARITKRPELQKEAIRQLEIFARHLQDPKTGLFYHMWDEKSAEHTPSFWARGNGWVVMSCTEVLKNEKAGSRQAAGLTDLFKRQLAGIVPLQNKETGLWHTVLDQPDTYQEGSASSMFLYGMAECRNLKLFDVPYVKTMRRAWAGLARTIQPSGWVGGVSAGTGPSGKSGYVARQVGTYTWGTGAFLLAACAYAESDLSGSFVPARQSKSLFNGKDLNGWHLDIPKMDKDPNVESAFVVRDGLLVSLGNPKGHLITDAVYQNYRLEVQYRFAAKPGNCGVLVHASTPRALYSMFPKSIEVQMNHKHAGDFWCIVEDITVPDTVERRGPKEKWGVTEGKARRILNLTDDSENPVGEWNTMVIECLGSSVKVWVNGDLVNHGFDCTADKGQIALQAEGSEVEFRKLQLTPITRLNNGE